VLLYYITGRKQLASEAELLERIRAAAEAGVDFIQLREKDLTARQLERLAIKAQEQISQSGAEARLLVNSRMDVAAAVGAAGVHLPAAELMAGDARGALEKCGVRNPVVAVSCHRVEEVAMAEAHGADFAIFGPVFEKAGTPNAGGLHLLRLACNRADAAQPPMPVLAVGGIKLANAAVCLQSGAAGLAGIRLFQSGEVQSTVAAVRNLKVQEIHSKARFPYAR
jgi:thiamine-phosphate pyrophosphorylase